MNEISVFKIAFDFDLSRLKKLPADLDKILKEVQSAFESASEKISKGTTATVPDIEVNPYLILSILMASLRKKIIDVITGIIAGLVIEQVTKKISESIEGQKTELERLKNLETEVITLRRQATEGLQDVEKFGERPNAIDENGLSLDTASIQERIDLVNALLDKITILLEELTHGALKSGIPEQPRPNEEIRNMFGPQNIILEIDRVKPLEDELRKIIEDTNKKIEERSQLLPLLENAYASLGGSTSALIASQGQITDAFSESTINAVNLVEKGINPLTGKASDLGISLEDLFKNTSEGAVIFGYTKEELFGLRDATDNAAKSAENLGENGITAVTDNAKEAGKTLGTMDSSLGNVGDKAQALDKTIVTGTDNIQDYGNTAKKAADGGLTDLESKVEDVSTAASNLNLAEALKDLAGFDPSRFLPGFIKPFTKAKEQIVEVGETIEEVQNQGGFFEGIKQGFKDFVESVGSNSQLIADFFADTLSQMSQNFSDLFFNVITGRFDDLKDLAKQAFEAILRSFLDLVSAIATRQIVLSIGGLFGLGKGAQAAGGGDNPLELGQQGVGLLTSGAGLFGSTGAFATLGDEEKEFRLAA